MRHVEIARASRRDAWALGLLYKACFLSNTLDWLKHLRLFLRSDVIVLKAVADEKLIGFVVLHSPPKRNRAFILALGVDPAWRGQGLGEDLMRACEERCGLPYVRLYVSTRNQPAIQLYRKLGYAMIKLVPGYYSAGDDAYVMEKRLGA